MAVYLLPHPDLGKKKIGASVNVVRKTRTGAVLVRKGGADQAKRLLDWDALKVKGLETKLEVARRPRLEVRGVPRDWDSTILEGHLWCKTTLEKPKEVRDRREWMRLCFSTPARGGLTKNWVFEVHHTMRLALMTLTLEDVSGGWWCLFIRDYLDPLLCLVCLEHGHLARACTTKEIACRWCDGTAHKIVDCPAKARGHRPTCRHCKANGREGKELHHCAGSMECPLYLELMIKQVKRTRYA